MQYYDELLQEEQEELKAVLKLLYRQTFLLERKYDKKTKRLLFTKEYQTAMRHLDFLRDYLKVSGVEILDNSQEGILYIRGEETVGEKLPKLATFYLLLLKLIYEEQMSEVSSSVNVFTNLGELNEKLGSFRLLRDRPSPTEIRRSLTLLKKYQMIELLDSTEEITSEIQMVIYPSVKMVLLGSEIRKLLESFSEDEEDEEERTI
ncbi:MAG: DUF4194 domain-containing protein [Lachnospiraceae bacterium]|nr:DUF4194 domain-containing protein [Lachnospiraceae bacterium]